MATVDETITIHRPRSEVNDYATDPSNVTVYWPTCPSTR